MTVLYRITVKLSSCDCAVQDHCNSTTLTVRSTGWPHVTAVPCRQHKQLSTQDLSVAPVVYYNNNNKNFYFDGISE